MPSPLTGYDLRATEERLRRPTAERLPNRHPYILQKPQRLPTRGPATVLSSTTPRAPETHETALQYIADPPTPFLKRDKLLHPETANQQKTEQKRSHPDSKENQHVHTNPFNTGNTSKTETPLNPHNNEHTFQLLPYTNTIPEKNSGHRYFTPNTHLPKKQVEQP